MRIVYLGSSEFGIPCLESLKDGPHQLIQIFTQPAQPAGRGRHPRPTPVAEWAARRGVPCEETANINAPESIRRLTECRGELLVVIAFGQKISQEVIVLFPHGAINVHASLLPLYRGAAPINAALIDGRSESGISIITLADRMDAGLILGQSRTEILPDDNAQSLHDRLALLSPDLLLTVIGQIAAGTATYTPQDESRVTYAKKLKKADGFLDFARPAVELANRIRGLWPWPGAQASFVSASSGKCYPVAFARAVAVHTHDQPGTFGLLDANLDIVCGDGRLRILDLKPAGRNLMSFDAFARGREVKPGDLFLSIE
ncbi:MAG: methionyl-tRNA formyltransferase [Phycisphaerae bacterium]|nr:methionyl-tRNA formyltransferase [Phycisphaerae bacterium]